MQEQCLRLLYHITALFSCSTPFLSSNSNLQGWIMIALILVGLYIDKPDRQSRLTATMC